MFVKSRYKNYIEIIAVKFYGAAFRAALSCPDKKKFKNGSFMFLDTFSNIGYFLKLYPGMIWDSEVRHYHIEYHKFKEKEKELTELKIKKNIISNFSYKTKPYKHQLRAFEISKKLESFALLFEQGCGKTKVVIDTSNYLYDKKEITSLVVIAPNGVHKNWVNEEIPIHLNCKYEAFCWERVKAKEKLKELEKIRKSEKLKIYSFNIDCFVSEKKRLLLQDILEKEDCLLCIDESQKIKNYKAKRTKFFLKVSNLAKYRRILTGTPITKGVQDIYSQFMFLDPKIIGISNYYSFRSRYCVMGGYESRQVIGYRKIEELQKRIEKYSIRVLKKDCLDLPKKIYQTVYFDLTTEQYSMYKQVLKDGLLYLNNMEEEGKGKGMIFKHMITRIIKMQQISSGYIYDTENEEYKELVIFTKNPKLKKLKELLKNIEGKVIIWTKFTKDVDLIMQLLRDEAVRYDGQVDGVSRETNKREFKTNPDIKYFVANLQTGSTGLTLTEAETVIYYSNSYDLELRLQSEDRCHRIGTVNNVNYIDLQANKTIDKKILNNLRNKKSISDMLLNDPQSLFMETK